MRIGRRSLLRGALGAGAAATLGRPGPARAEVAPADRLFVFVTAYFGWDPTRVFATTFDHAAVSMEADATLASSGGLSWVSHSSRPTVDAVMARWADRILVFNGVLVSSVSHTACLYRQFTGTSRVNRPDIPSILAHHQADRFVLPSVIVRGPSFPGPLANVASRVGSSGQTEALLSGELVEWGDLAVPRFSPEASAAMDRYLSEATGRRLLEALGPRDSRMLLAHSSANRTAAALEGLVDQVDWGAPGDRSLEAQVDVARGLLALGAARCVSLLHDRRDWDSHVDNDRIQANNFEELFQGVEYLLDQLEATPGPDGRPLSERTTVVVWSEMGRAPALNIVGGKDHWPYTSVMVVSDGLTTNRVIGGWDELYYGRSIDLGSGEVDDAGVDLRPGVVGATLLRLGGVDPGEWMTEDDPLEGALI